MHTDMYIVVTLVAVSTVCILQKEFMMVVSHEIMAIHSQEYYEHTPLCMHYNIIIHGYAHNSILQMKFCMDS